MTRLLDRILGVGLYGAEGTGASYLLLSPILRGPLGIELSRTLVAWAIAVGSLAAWWAVFRKESRERANGKLPPFSGGTPRLAMMVFVFGVFLGSIIAVSEKLKIIP